MNICEGLEQVVKQPWLRLADSSAQLLLGLGSRVAPPCGLLDTRCLLVHVAEVGVEVVAEVRCVLSEKQVCPAQSQKNRSEKSEI